ncbi:MAG: DUF4199 domain-containing protein [Bacteroidota bacterium]|nr:DUF4199 domain-containing protein [Bacteroidota bacterium]
MSPLKPYLSTSLIYGTITGLAAFVWFIGVYYSGANAFYSFQQKLSILLQAVAAYFAIKHYRDKQKEGLLSFGEGIIIGMLVALVTALIAGVGIFIFSNYIQPQMITEHVQTLRRYMEVNKTELINRSSEEMYKGNLKGVDEVSAFSLALDDFIWKIIRGTMFSILVSLVLRRSKV